MSLGVRQLTPLLFSGYHLFHKYPTKTNTWFVQIFLPILSIRENLEDVYWMLKFGNVQKVLMIYGDNRSEFL